MSLSKSETKEDKKAKVEDNSVPAEHYKGMPDDFEIQPLPNGDWNTIPIWRK